MINRVATSYSEFAPPRGLEAHVACLWASHDRAVNVLPDACVDIVQAALALVRDGASLREAAQRVGVGERQLRRRFERAVGYSPATLVRIQRFLALADREPATPLVRLALEAGYADQAHLSRECRRLSGLPPAALLAAGSGPAGEKSVSFKPHSAESATLAA